MNAIELYNASHSALKARDTAKAAKVLVLLAEAMDAAMMTRGWHKFPLTGDTTLDSLIEKANRNLTGTP